MPRLDETLVRQLMTARVEAIKESASVYDAVRQMVRLNIGSLAVVPDDPASGDTILGLLPVYQMLPHLLNSNQGRDVQARDVMFSEHVTVEADVTIYAALKRVTSNRSWRLIVVDPKGKPIGVISATDIMKWLVEVLSSSAL